MSQIVAMAKRLQEAEQTIIELRNALEARPSPEHQTPRMSDLTSNISGTSSEFAKAELVLGSQEGRLPRQARSPSKEPTSEELLSDLSLDEHGKVDRAPYPRNVRWPIVGI